MEDFSGVFWVILIILGIAGKLFDKKGPRHTPVSRPGRPGQPAQRQAGQPPAPRGDQVRPQGALYGPGQLSAPTKGEVLDDYDGEGVTMEGVRATVHNWGEARFEPEPEPAAVVQPIPIQQAVVWAEILGKPAALRGRRR